MYDRPFRGTVHGVCGKMRGGRNRKNIETMKTFKNILMVLGGIGLVLLLCLLFFGIKVLGAVFAWVFGFFAVVFLIGWTIYMVGKARGRRIAESHGDKALRP